jgi:hypothetical protein
MSRAIWKYELPTRGAARVPIPVGATLLCVQEQNEKPTVWALVNPDAKRADWLFVVRLTGADIDDGPVGDYVGTVQIGWYVAHVFSLGNGPVQS